MTARTPEQRARYNANRRAVYAANPEKFRQEKRDEYARDPEKFRARDQERRLRDGDKIRAQARARYAADLEKHRASRRRHYAANAEKYITAVIAYKRANPEKVSVWNKNGRARWTPEQRREKNWRTVLYVHGLTPEIFAEMVIAQSGLCGICQCQLQDPHIDHDHDTDEVRGLLCDHCNWGIGQLGDSADVVAAAIEYLLDPPVGPDFVTGRPEDPDRPGDPTYLYERRKKLRQNFEMTLADVDALVVAQNGLCAICSIVLDPACVDHDHETGAIRGLLCQPCNFALGQFGDNQDLLEAAIAYLTRGGR